MTRNYSQFYNYISKRLTDDGGKLISDNYPRYREFEHDGHQVFLPYYHKYAFTVFYGDKVFYCRRKFAERAGEDFEFFLKRIVNG